MSANSSNHVIISAILEKDIDGVRHIFIQTRWKPLISPTFSGLLEIPAGVVEPYEDVFDALYREVKEETGLNITSVIDAHRGHVVENRPGNKTHVFTPFVCQQTLTTDGGLPWIGFVFRCIVSGEIHMQKEEAQDPQWMNVSDLKKILDESPERIFPLQYPVLKHYVESIDQKK
ncbi:MAG: NUDIX hydrolase [Candidatus Roizmanbacteria bacterium]